MISRLMEPEILSVIAAARDTFRRSFYTDLREQNVVKCRSLDAIIAKKSSSSAAASEDT